MTSGGGGGQGIHSVFTELSATTIQEDSESEVAQSCLNLCDPMDCNLPSSSVHGIFHTEFLSQGNLHNPRGSLIDSLG